MGDVLLMICISRELIIRRPEEFKIACLRDLRRLFPHSHNPFFAGFGNRITDALAYRSVDIPASKIFTIDHRGHLRLELVIGYRSSYVNLNDMVDHVFPPLKDEGIIHQDPTSVRFSEYFNDLNYWKQPLPDISYLFPKVEVRTDTYEDDDDVRFTVYPYV
jgi:phosphatidate phosphatase LPIN